ncbi:titin homolog [Vigna unguiculata]|uniref:titin homolog n=1 Tax=Vigna unguiculata TaxID=3917 RepID=UPI00101650D1|nr:titin homolog [Vigna unguiculata]
MDLELGLKITKTRDDIASISKYRLAKAGPVFQSRETNTAFILTAHLKGYKKNNINIKISEDGSKISVSGEKPVQNILMMGWLMHKKEVDVAGFNKVFRIPDGVKLDGIKAKYDEEEWIMNIIMPKLVKGICGVKIEEIKEEESDGRRSEQEKNEGDLNIPSAVGETSQKGAKESEVQAMEDSERFMEKKAEVSNNMLDDSNREKTKDTVHREVEESKVGNDGGNGDSFREVGKEGCEVKNTSEQEKKVGVGTSQKIGEEGQKEIKELKLKNEDGRVKTSAKGESVGEGMPKNIGGDTRQDQELKVQEMEDNGGFLEKEEKGVSENMLDDTNANIIGDVIQKEEESKSGIKDRDGESVKEKNVRAGHKGMKISETEQNVGAHVIQNVGDTIQGVSKDSVIEQIGENKSIVEKMEREEPEEMLVEANVPTERETLGDSNQKQFREPRPETEDRLKESVKENRMETMKAPELDQNVDDHVPSNIGGISQEEHKESRIQWEKKTKRIKENMDEWKSEKIPIQASEDGKKHIYGKSMQENIKKPKIETGNEDHIETGNGDQEYGVKAGKEEFDSMETRRETFPQKLPKGTIEEGKRLSVSKMQETEDVIEAKIKTKWKENEYLVVKDEGEEHRRMHKQAKKDLAKETLRENEDVKEAMDKRERKEIEYFVNKSAGEEHKRRHMEAKKDLAKETMKKNEAAMDKREDKEIEYFLEARKDLTTKKIQETEDIKEKMSKTKDKGIEKFEDTGERKEHNRLYMKAKDFKKETIQENEDIQEAMIKREGKNNEHFGDKRGENPQRMHMEAKKNIGKEIMQETDGGKEATVKRKREEIGNFTDKVESEEPTKMLTHAKKELTKETEQENEKVKEAMLKTKDKETEHIVDKGEPKSMNVEPKKDLTTKIVQESEHVREAMVKGEGKGYKYFVDKDVSEEPERMHVEPKKDMAKEKLQEIESSKEATVKMKGKEIENFVVKDGGEENKMNMKLKKESTKETKQGSENVKEAMGKMKGKETKYFVDKGEGEEPKSMHVEAKKEDDREGKDHECFVDKGEGEETKRMLMERKNVEKETMQEIEGVKEAMVKRKGKEIENLADKDEAGELTKMLVKKSNKELTKEKKQQSEKIKEAMVKRKGKETEYFADKGEDKEPKSMYVEEKDLTTKTTQESEEPKRMHIKPKDITKDTVPKTGVKEAMVKTKDKEIENFVEKFDGEERIKMLVKELPKERNKREKFKEVMVQKKVKETEYCMDKDEEEPINMHVEAEKDLTSKTVLEREDVRKEVVETEGKGYEYFVDEGESKEHKMTNMEAKKNMGKESMQERKGAKEAMAKRKGKEIGRFEKGEDKETKKVHMEAKKDLTTVTMQESDGTDEGNENKCLSDEGEGEEPNRMYMGTKRDLTKEEMHENDDAKETVIKRKGKEIEYLVGNSGGEVEEPKRIHTAQKKELATKTMHEIEDANEIMVKRKHKEIENFEDNAKGKESKIREAKKDSTKVTMKESDYTREAMVKRKGKEVENFVDKGEEPQRMHTEAKKELTTKRREESEFVREAMVKREGEEEMDYFLKEGEDEKDIPKEKIQIVEKIEHGIMDKDQQNVLGKTTKRKAEVPTEEGPKLVGGQDGSRGLEVSNMEDTKEIIKEEMAETESSREKVQEQKSKKKEETSRVIQKTTATEILQKETEESNNERNTTERPNLPNNMVKVVFEVLGTFQAKLPKKVMEAIGQNKEKNEYVIVKLKAEGSIEMHVEPNEAFDEDETEERSEKEVRKPKLKSTEQISGRENVDFGVFDGSKRSKFLEMGETQGAKEDNTQMEETVKKINEEQSEKIEVEEKGRKSSQKGREGPKIQTMVQNQHRLQEEKEMPLGKTTEGELAQAITTHSKAKSEIDELHVNQLPSPSIEMRNIEPRESKKDGLKEFIHSIDSTAASEVVADEAAEPSKFLSSSSTQPFEVEGKDKIGASYDYESQDSEMDSEIDGEASTKGETDEEVLQRETPQPEFPEDQQCTHKALEETHEIEEEKEDEQVDESDQEDSEELEEQKECEEEAIGGKKDQKRSKKMIVSTIIAGSALLASGIFLIIRHRRSTKGAK